ncbi:MMPL family transporter [Catenulispora sp. NF23]|uniref:MMPL family transporter n=1 Tax=Catenulispora pinistramenti TaxID=2705254 RepID=UPI001BA6B843|nr:MMPL family transporter [Catenulispora pinistramenti]MBS2535107.1 MMPL family transporter [Catenulispora pinistramenti]
MSAIARWCHRHRLLTVVVWLALIVGLGALTGSAGTKYNDTMSIPASESSQAMDLLKQSMPASAGDSDQVVWHTTGGAKVTDPDVQQSMTGALNQIAASPGVAGVTSPYTGPRGATQISKDGTTAFATVNFAQQAHDIPNAQIVHVIDVAQGARNSHLQVELGGQAISQADRKIGGAADLIGVIAALIVLGLVFRAVGAAVMPILTGVAGVVTGITGTGQLSHLISISSTAPTLATLVGLGVGIDYALFIVNRHRKGLISGLSVEESIAKALNTSGRAVLFAGGTVVIALLGMFALGLGFLDGMAIGAAVTVSMTVLAAITLLPAMLGFLKLRVLSKKQRRELAARQAGVSVLVPYAHAARRRSAGPGRERGTAFTRWATRVQARPLGKALLAIAVMAVVAIPFFSIRLGNSDAGNDPKSTTTRQAYDLLADGFGKGFNGPLMLVAQTPAAGDQQALTTLVDQIKTVPGVAAVQARPEQPGQALGVVQVIPTTSPQDQGTTDLIDTLRHDVIPKAEAGTTLHVMVSGPTAISNDFSHTLTGKLPLFVAIIVGLGCVLMMLAFRSLLVPLIGVAMNLLTMGVAFGALVAVFQWGWGSETLGAGGAGPVEAFVPVIVISILFGLSMDYQVFLISRMHEEWSHSKDNSRSVRIGHGETGQVIVAAGVIMTCVFGAFLFNGERVIAEFGLALAVAILLDVLMLRLILVPALMHRFGRANWWLPKWLDKVLPHMSVEGEPEPVAGGVVIGGQRSGSQYGPHDGPYDEPELASSNPRIQ